MRYILFSLLIALSLLCCQCVTGDASLNSLSDKIKDVDKYKSKTPAVKEETEPVTEKTKENVPSNTLPNPNNDTKNTTELKKGDENLYEKMVKNKKMLMRTFYVLLGVTSIVVLYFVIRAWRSKRRHSKSRKYGLITSSGADLEMEPLDQDVDDDDEMTMFERQK